MRGTVIKRDRQQLGGGRGDRPRPDHGQAGPCNRYVVARPSRTAAPVARLPR